MTRAVGLSAAGFAATAIGYGPARMGFGLFVPQFRESFSMSSSLVGLVSGLGFCGFLAGLLAAQVMLMRRGPEAPVLTGLLAATAGMGLIAVSTDVRLLAAGVLLAASSAGFAWTPFNDAVHRKVRSRDRPRALSMVSTGTSIGIAAAGAAALGAAVTGLDWRACWLFFTCAGALVLILNWAALHPVGKSPDPGPASPWRPVLRFDAAPLFATAFVFGMTSAVYITFAADHVRGATSAATAPAVLFIGYGLFGLSGLLSGRARQTLGLTRLLRLLMLADALALALVAVFPASWPAVIGSAGLQGAHVMMTSAVLAFWSERLFPSLPSLGFTAALLFSAAGSVLGTTTAGLAADTFGPATMLCGTALLPTVAALSLRRRFIRERSLIGADQGLP